jgi:hypothetical protein
LQSLDEVLKHHGVKGMHWGKHHGGHGSDTPFKERGKIGKHWDSLKRERAWKTKLKDIHNMSTKDINALTKRISAENTLKDNIKHPIATAKDKQDYLRRHEMSDEELKRKNNRLAAKKSLYEAVVGASKEQKKKIAAVGQTAATIALKKATGQKIGVSDIMEAVNNPTIKTKQNAWDEGIKIAEGKATHPKVKTALKVAKVVKIGSGGKSKS